MIVEQIYTKCLAGASYYIESQSEAAVIDPVRETLPYLSRAEKSGAKIKYIFETHFHADFVSGHLDLARKCGAKIVFGPTAETEYEMYEGKDDEEFPLGNIIIRLLHTPGHTNESSSFLLIDKNGNNHSVFTGDTLFIGDVGRPDLAMETGVSKEDLAGLLYDSIHNKIMVLEDNVVVYPAHGAGSACGKHMSKETFSTLGVQKKDNYALQNISKEEFVKQVTEGILPPPLYFPKVATLNKKGYKNIEEVVSNGTQPLSIDRVEMEIDSGAIVLDTRHQQTFNKGFIPGTISLSIYGAFDIWAAVLIPDINGKIVIVVDDGKEEEVVTRLSRAGFDNVIGFLNGGFEAWQFSGKPVDSITSITPDEFGDIAKNDNIKILDVRKPMEFDTGHVVKAMNFPLDFIHQNSNKLENNGTYYVYCQGGFRSMAACSILKSQGYKNVVNVADGFSGISRTGAVEIESVELA